MENREALKEGRIWLCLGSFLTMFLSLLAGGPSLPIVSLWLFCSGMLVTFTFFWHYEKVPNILIHLRSPAVEVKDSTSSPPACPVCGVHNCTRLDARDALDGNRSSESATLPENVNQAIEEFLEIALEKFVYSWETDLLKSEAFVDEVRQGLRCIAVALTERAAKVDVASLVLNKMTAATVRHLQHYMTARIKSQRLSFEPMDRSLSRLVLAECRSSVHWSQRGLHTDHVYCKKLLSSVMPHVLPPSALESPLVCSFLQNLLASKIMKPAIDYVTKPDVVNKLLLLAVDRNSRMCKGCGPVPRPVAPLVNFSQRRHLPTSPLTCTFGSVASDQKQLYHFMSFMKDRGAVSVLQSCIELKGLQDQMTGSELSNEQALALLKELQEWRKKHLRRDTLALVDWQEDELCEGEEGEGDPVERIALVVKAGVIPRLQDRLIRELNQDHLSMYFQSDEFFCRHYGHRAGKTKRGTSAPDKLSNKLLYRLMDKKRSQSLLSSRSVSLDRLDQSGEVLTEPGSEDEQQGGPSLSAPLPLRVQIVDFELRSDGPLTSYTVYVILTKRQSTANGGGKSQVVVRRRFREFVALDEKLQQFYGSLRTSLPPRKTVGNMNKEFLEKRRAQLQKYLMDLVMNEDTSDNQLLLSFLTDTSDASQFTPHSRAGKVLKTVPQMLKKERGRNVEVYLKDLVNSTECPPQASGQEAHAESPLRAATTRRELERYLTTQETDRDKADSELYAPHPRMFTNVSGLYEMLLFTAERFFCLPSWMLFFLRGFKFLGQRTVEVLSRRFIQQRVKAVTYDGNLVPLIHMLRDNVLLHPTKPRGVEEVAQRQREALEAVTTRPPAALVHLIGQESHEWGVWMLFMALQSHQLNKQLVYNLLDLIVLELFPELKEDPISSVTEGVAMTTTNH